MRNLALAVGFVWITELAGRWVFGRWLAYQVEEIERDLWAITRAGPRT